MPTLDLTGQRFGKLTVIEPTQQHGRLVWRCKCDCGRLVVRSVCGAEDAFYGVTAGETAVKLADQLVDLARQTHGVRARHSTPGPGLPGCAPIWRG